MPLPSNSLDASTPVNSISRRDAEGFWRFSAPPRLCVRSIRCGRTVPERLLGPVAGVAVAAEAERVEAIVRALFLGPQPGQRVVDGAQPGLPWLGQHLAVLPH